MKNIIAALSLSLSVFCLSACSALKTTGAVLLGVMMAANSVQNDFDRYVEKNGAPTSHYTLQTGETIYTFIRPCNNSQEYEEKQVKVDTDNVIIREQTIRSCPQY